VGKYTWLTWFVELLVLPLARVVLEFSPAVSSCGVQVSMQLARVRSAAGMLRPQLSLQASWALSCMAPQPDKATVVVNMATSLFTGVFNVVSYFFYDSGQDFQGLHCAQFLLATQHSSF